MNNSITFKVYANLWFCLFPLYILFCPSFEKNILLMLKMLSRKATRNYWYGLLKRIKKKKNQNVCFIKKSYIVLWDIFELWNVQLFQFFLRLYFQIYFSFSLCDCYMWPDTPKYYCGISIGWNQQLLFPVNSWLEWK